VAVYCPAGQNRDAYVLAAVKVQEICIQIVWNQIFTGDNHLQDIMSGYLLNYHPPITYLSVNSLPEFRLEYLPCKYYRLLELYKKHSSLLVQPSALIFPRKFLAGLLFYLSPEPEIR